MSNSIIDANNIKQISGGAGHILILTKNNTVFSCGWNLKGQLGANTPNESLVFIEIFQNKKIEQISSGWDYNAAVSCTNELFVWGSNAFSQLGVAKKIQDTFEPIKIENLNAVQVSCGLRHCAVLKSDGTVAICGSGNKGQLGLLVNGEKLKETEFIDIPDLCDITAVSCGQYHTLALQLNGIVYGWGSNKHGQLGVNPEECAELPTPFKIDLNVIPAQIFTGWTHSVILTKDGDLINFGRNLYSQLGSERGDKNWLPTKLECDKVKEFSAGSEHNLAITCDGKLLCWGWNEHGNCGAGDVEDVKTPMEILPNKNCIYVSCGTGQSFAIIDV